MILLVQCTSFSFTHSLPLLLSQIIHHCHLLATGKWQFIFEPKVVFIGIKVKSFSSLLRIFLWEVLFSCNYCQKVQTFKSLASEVWLFWCEFVGLKFVAAEVKCQVKFLISKTTKQITAPNWSFPSRGNKKCNFHCFLFEPEHQNSIRHWTLHSYYLLPLYQSYAFAHIFLNLKKFFDSFEQKYYKIEKLFLNFTNNGPNV